MLDLSRRQTTSAEWLRGGPQVHSVPDQSPCRAWGATRRGGLTGTDVGLEIRRSSSVSPMRALTRSPILTMLRSSFVDNHRQMRDLLIGHAPQDVVHPRGQAAAEHVDVHDPRDGPVKSEAPRSCQVALPDHACQRRYGGRRHSSDVAEQAWEIFRLKPAPLGATL